MGGPVQVPSWSETLLQKEGRDEQCVYVCVCVAEVLQWFGDFCTI